LNSTNNIDLRQTFPKAINDVKELAIRKLELTKR
jgi:hypothetical protein